MMVYGIKDNTIVMMQKMNITLPTPTQFDRRHPKFYDWAHRHTHTHRHRQTQTDRDTDTDTDTDTQRQEKSKRTSAFTMCTSRTSCTTAQSRSQQSFLETFRHSM
eukprot:5923870-Amphidinium_carterae.3